MQRILRITGTLAMLAIVTASSSCNLFAVFDPCPDSTGVEDVGQMDDTWELQTVNGAPLPYVSLRVAQAERITRLKLSFETTESEPVGGNCHELIESSGNAYAEITIATTASVRTEYGNATFARNHLENTASIEAEHGSVALVRPDLTSNNMTISSTDLNLLTDEPYFVPNLVLRFVRTVRPGQ